MSQTTGQQTASAWANGHSPGTDLAAIVAAMDAREEAEGAQLTVAEKEWAAGNYAAATSLALIGILRLLRERL